MRFISFYKESSEEILEHVEKYINKNECKEMGIDLSGLNVFDASKILLLSSALHYNKYPEGKLKCKVKSKGIENLITGLSTRNLEIV